MTLANAKPDLLMTGPLGNSMVNAASSAWHDVITVEAKITAAIAYAVSVGAKYCYVPDSFLPYTASLVTFNTGVVMLREGGNNAHLDVKAYGAAGNGVQDDTAAFTAATAAAAVPGGAFSDSVWAPAGTYVAAITYPTDKKIRILGDGCDATIIRAPAASAFAITSASTHTIAGWHCELRDLSIDGNANAGPAVTISGMTKFLMMRVRIFNCQGTGLKVFQCFDCAFFDVFVDGDGGVVGATAPPVVIDGTDSTVNSTDECSFYRLHIEVISSNQVYLTLNNTRYCDFYYLKLAGNFNNAQPNSVPLMTLSSTAHDNAVLGGTIAYCNGAPQIQVNAGSFNRFWGLVHIAGISFPTYAYEFTGAAADNEVLGATSVVSGFTSGFAHFGASSLRNRIAKCNVPNMATLFVADAGYFQNDWEQPQVRPGATIAGGGSTTPNPAIGKHHDLIASGATMTVNAPINALDGMELEFTINNNSGGALVTTWNAIFKLAGAWVDPANTKRRAIRYKYLSYLPGWVEISRAAADI